MKKFFILTIMVFTAFALSLASCEEECEDCQNHYYYDDAKLEDDACEALHDCTIGDLIVMSAAECDDNNYPEECWVALVESESCYDMKIAFKNECDGEENSSSSNNTTTNNSNTTDYDDLCDIIRVDCGYDDNLSQNECTDNLMAELGSIGRNCIDQADNCTEVQNCLDDYAY